MNLIRFYKYSFVLMGLGALYTAFLILIHGDTMGDYRIFAQDSIRIQYGIDQWFNWSSRLLIENSANFFSKYLWLWKVLTVISGALLFWSLGRIMGIKRVYQAVILFCLMLLVNTNVLATAGIFATTINYLWPATCFALVIAVLLVPFKNKVMQRVSLVAIWPLYIYAMCSEQLAVLGLLFIGAYVGFKLYKKQRVPVMVWVLLAITVIGILNVLVSPGNDNRKALEIMTWWPGFDSLPLFYKIAMGTIVLFSRLFIAPEVPAILLVLLLAGLSYKLKNITAFVSILPALVILMLFIFPDTYGLSGTNIRSINYFNDLGQRAIAFDSRNLPGPAAMREYLVVFGVLTASIIASITCLFGRTLKTAAILGILAAGVAVSMAVAFSPTLFASNTRTLYPLLIIIVCINYYLVNRLIDMQFFQSTIVSTGLRSK